MTAQPSSAPQAEQAARPAPLAGLRVLDLTVALAGPFCTLMLGGLGAEVIKIDAPGGSDIGRFNPPYVGPDGLNNGAIRKGDVSVSVFDRHRNKKSITLDLKAPEGLELFRQMARSADIVVENFSSGATERLGISYAEVAAINPQIIYASISAMGDSLAYGNIKSMDITVQALSGVMEVNGFADGPPCRVGFPIADLLAPHYAVIGILSALAHRANGGGGQHVQVNLLDSLVSLLAIEHFDLAADQSKLRTGNHHERLTPFGIFPTKDRHIAIAASSDEWTRLLFKAMEAPELADDPRYSTRGARAANAAELNRIIERWSSGLSSEAALAALVSHGVSAAPVRTPKEALADPEIIARGAVTRLRNPHMPDSVATTAPGVPIRFSECAVGYDQAAPLLGQDSDAVYRDLLGLSPEQILRYREDRVI